MQFIDINNLEIASRKVVASSLENEPKKVFYLESTTKLTGASTNLLCFQSIPISPISSGKTSLGIPYERSGPPLYGRIIYILLNILKIAAGRV